MGVLKMTLYINNELSNFQHLPEYNSKKLSQYTLTFICTDLHKFLEDLDASTNVILGHPLVDKQSLRIRPIECDSMINTFSEVQTSINGVAKLLQSANDLSVLVRIDRYKLLMDLYSVKDKAQRVVRKLIMFRSFCLKNTQERQIAQFEIQKEIMLIIHQFKKIKIEFEQAVDSVLLETTK